MQYIVMINGKDFKYKYFKNALKRYNKTKNTCMKKLYEIWLDNKNLYATKLLISN